VIVSLLLISSVVMVSASFKDWFSFGEEGKGEGELAESADVSVTLTNTPPVIESWVVPGTPPIPTELGTKDIDIVVTISDENGLLDLTDAAAVITAKVTNTNNHPTDNERSTSGECSNTGTIDANTGEFTCTIAMQYWDEEGAGWIVEVSAADKNDPGSPTVRTGTNGADDPNLNYGHFLGMILKDYPGGTASIGWAGIEGSTVNKEANSGSPVVVANSGNVAITGTVASKKVITIEGKDLLGIDTPANKLLAQSFAADDVSCDGIGGDTSLVKDDDKAIEGVSYDRRAIEDPTAQADIYFCINSIVSSAGAGTLPFDASGYETGVTPWLIGVEENYIA